MNGSTPDPVRADRPHVPGIRIEDLLRDFLSRAGELLEAQEHMRGLLEAVVAVAEDLSLEAVLDRVVTSACRLLRARYGALGVIGENKSLSHFVTVGIDEDLASRIGPLPTGHGVLGLLITEPAPLRLHDLHEHPKSYGFPENHPPMKSFLGVPVRVRDVVFGNLYLTEKEGGGDFTPEDEDLAVALAAAAGVAIENARLYEDARRRASWLEACMEVTGRMLSDDRMAEPNEVTLDLIADKALRESGSQLALILVPDGGVGSYAVAGAAGAGSERFAGSILPMDSAEIREVAATGKPACLDEYVDILGGPAGLSLGKLLAIDLSAQGAHHGLLLLVRASGTGPFAKTDVEMGAVFGSHVALALELDRIHRLREQLVVFTDRDRIARDLHDVVIQRLFAAGLSIQSLRRFTTGEPALTRIDAVTAELDATIRDLRNTIYSLQASSGEQGLLSSRILQAVRNATRSLPFAPHLTLTGAVDSVFDDGTVTNALAVISEGLSNAVRHSDAHAISVSVSLEGGMLTLIIEDNGRGFSDPVPGNGLVNMEQRAFELDGSCSIKSVPEQGTTLVWSVPAR
ncbi:GAF domain-containing sensor histidine kinase [Arthrobacter bambusae]|jgi:two-component system, NarL family, sensor histidine kinase DevS|uniref:GAF domain-containing sensor histidine kinase n=1 Tax=Arthrobacter bambusae TaxID=1338426 RepID=UPI002780A67E|nr:GAF domain-containing sensor histidine kinase [Arthrobacter bambusae]MDQ0210388.1 signal transduction histidine kinase [Arthrobacter bambusae]MDQ0234837.1 signal transduction histidine kinase [Arthrobacter bambusae]